MGTAVRWFARLPNERDSRASLIRWQETTELEVVPAVDDRVWLEVAEEFNSDGHIYRPGDWAIFRVMHRFFCLQRQTRQSVDLIVVPHRHEDSENYDPD